MGGIFVLEKGNMGVIYKIANTVNGKVYIGRTVRSFEIRVEEHVRHLSGNYHTNKHLQHAWNKYGETAFVFEPIEYSGDSETLYVLEHYWFGEYVTLLGRDNVYNIAAVVKGFWGKRKTVTDEARKNYSLAFYRRLNTDTTYREKLREYGKLGQRALRGKGKIVISEQTRNRMRQARLGHKHAEETLNKLRVAAAKRAKYRGIVVSPCGELYEIYNLSMFCKEHDLSYPAMLGVLSGKRPMYKNWTPINKREKRNTAKKYAGFISPDGIVYRDVVNLNDFCKQHGLTPSAMSGVNSGTLLAHKGWTKV